MTLNFLGPPLGSIELWDEDEEPDECDRYWKELSDKERKAAEVLGYNEVRWNID